MYTSIAILISFYKKLVWTSNSRSGFLYGNLYNKDWSITAQDPLGPYKQLKMWKEIEQN